MIRCAKHGLVADAVSAGSDFRAWCGRRGLFALLVCATWAAVSLLYVPLAAAAGCDLPESSGPVPSSTPGTSNAYQGTDTVSASRSVRVGDLVLVAVTRASGAPMGAPPGWTLVNSVQGASDFRTAIFSTRARQTGTLSFSMVLKDSASTAVLMVPLSRAGRVESVKSVRMEGAVLSTPSVVAKSSRSMVVTVLSSAGSALQATTASKIPIDCESDIEEWGRVKPAVNAPPSNAPTLAIGGSFLESGGTTVPYDINSLVAAASIAQAFVVTYDATPAVPRAAALPQVVAGKGTKLFTGVSYFTYNSETRAISNAGQPKQLTWLKVGSTGTFTVTIPSTVGNKDVLSVKFAPSGGVPPGWKITPENDGAAPFQAVYSYTGVTGDALVPPEPDTIPESFAVTFQDGTTTSMESAMLSDSTVPYCEYPQGSNRTGIVEILNADKSQARITAPTCEDSGTYLLFTPPKPPAGIASVALRRWTSSTQPNAKVTWTTLQTGSGTGVTLDKLPVGLGKVGYSLRITDKLGNVIDVALGNSNSGDTTFEYGLPPRLSLVSFTSTGGVTITPHSRWDGTTGYSFVIPLQPTGSPVTLGSGSFRVRVAPSSTSIKLKSVTFPTPPSGWTSSVSVDTTAPYETTYSWVAGANMFVPNVATALNTTGDTLATELDIAVAS